MPGFSILLRDSRFRRLWARLRFFFMRRNLRTFDQGSASVGETAIDYNRKALQVKDGFGCGGRMGTLIYPVIGYYSFYRIRRSDLKILMVGCRTEDDVLWMHAYGFKNAIGYDLISYSSKVLLGDIHDTPFDDASFDVVILGWMLSYSKAPDAVLRECRRIIRPGGLLGIGIEHDPAQRGSVIREPRANPLNVAGEIRVLLDKAGPNQLVFEYDHPNDECGDFSVAVIVRFE